MALDIFRKPWFAALFSSMLTILIFHLYNIASYHGAGTVSKAADVVAVKFNPKFYENRNCAEFKVPENVSKRVPHILQTGRVQVVDYDKFPKDDSIECVTHHAAVSPTKICIMPTKKDSFISGSLRSMSGWEPHITRAFKRALNDCPDCQVLDFGSNLGVYGLIGASAGRQVVAVEPMHENLLHLVKSVRLNNWEKRVTIVTNTLSNVYEQVEFWRPWSNAGGSIARLVGASPPDRKLYDGPYDKVSSVQIDNLLEIVDFNKAVLKIDVEGYEPRAFTGASRFFAQIDIPIIFMEWSNKSTDKMALKMVQDLVRMGYEVYDPNMVKLAMPKDPVKDGAAIRWPFDIVWKKVR